MSENKCPREIKTMASDMKRWLSSFIGKNTISDHTKKKGVAFTAERTTERKIKQDSGETDDKNTDIECSIIMEKTIGYA